jgi:hypothetical protein
MVLCFRKHPDELCRFHNKTFSITLCPTNVDLKRLNHQITQSGILGHKTSIAALGAWNGVVRRHGVCKFNAEHSPQNSLNLCRTKWAA